MFRAFGHDAGGSVGKGHAETDQCACHRCAAEVFFSFVLSGKVYRGFDNGMCLFRGTEGEDHDGARSDQEVPRGFGRTQQRSHQEAVRACSCSVGGVIYEGGVACERNSDEVDKVVTGEGEGEGEGSHQYHYFEYVDFADQQEGVVLYPLFVFGSHEGAVFQPFDQHKVDDGSGGYATEQTDAVFDVFRVVEREDDAGEPLY